MLWTLYFREFIDVASTSFRTWFYQIPQRRGVRENSLTSKWQRAIKTLWERQLGEEGGCRTWFAVIATCQCNSCKLHRNKSLPAAILGTEVVSLWAAVWLADCLIAPSKNKEWGAHVGKWFTFLCHLVITYIGFVREKAQSWWDLVGEAGESAMKGL